MFNIAEFKSIIGKHGVARLSNFAVNITSPSTISDSFINDLPFLVDTANIPSLTYQTEEYRVKGYGLSEARPFQITFDPVTITLIGDASNRVYGFFDKWLSLVHNFDEQGETSSYQIGSELFNYPEQYWGTVEIHCYDVTSKIYRTVKLSKAWPQTLGSVQVGWEQVDSLMRIPITFLYRTISTTQTDQLRSQSTNVNTMTNSNARNSAELQKLLINPNIQTYQQRLQVN